MKKIYLYGNWKMNMTCQETKAFLQDWQAEIAACTALNSAFPDSLEAALFPTFTSLGAMSASANSDKCFPFWGAQNVYYEPKGAFTGEVSIPMLLELGCTRVIIGHSERRAIFCESDELIAHKVEAALKAGLRPVLCFGETLKEREEGHAFDVVDRQLQSALKGRSSAEIEKIIYAYEPVWAIGTGKSASSAEAAEVCAHAKALIKKAGGVKSVVLYGGSVKAENARELLAMESIDGALVGGASLKAKSFLDIYKAYARI